jgi:hypothetical protein
MERLSMRDVGRWQNSTRKRAEEVFRSFIHFSLEISLLFVDSDVLQMAFPVAHP